MHNHRRQHELALEKCWVTQNGVFRILLTLIGINVTDAFILCKKEGILGPLATVGVGSTPANMKRFAGVLCTQLLKLAEQQSDLLAVRSVPPSATLPVAEEYMDQYNTLPPLSTDRCRITTVTSEIKDGTYDAQWFLEDRAGGRHTICKFGEKYQKNGKKYRTPHVCTMCQNKMSIVFCLECQKVYCFPLRRSGSVSDIHAAQAASCFQHHVDICRRESGRKRRATEGIEEL